MISLSAPELLSFMFSFVDFKQGSVEICYCQADINLSAYRKHVQSQNAPKPLTFAEEELEEIKRKEVMLLFYSDVSEQLLKYCYSFCHVRQGCGVLFFVGLRLPLQL